MYINSTTNTNQTAFLTSPCLDMSRLVNPSLTFWYHMYGSDINTLYIESNASGNWQIIDSIVGQQQNSTISPWIQDSIPLIASQLSPYFKIRFRSFVNGQNSNIAIDDISIFGDSIVTSNTYISDLLKDENLNIYPNPNTGVFYIKGSEEIFGKNYEILNIQGQNIQKGQFQSNQEKVEIKNKAKGIYFLRVRELGIQTKIVVY